MTITMRSIDHLPVIDLGCLGSKLVKQFEHSQGSQIDHYILDQAFYLRLHRMGRESAERAIAPLLSRYCVALHIIVLDSFAAAAHLSLFYLHQPNFSMFLKKKGKPIWHLSSLRSLCNFAARHFMNSFSVNTRGLQVLYPI